MPGRGAGGAGVLVRERASRYAWYGTAIAIAAVVLATAMVCVHVYDGIGIDNILRAHRDNAAIWILDGLPFLYAAWGQYASLNMAQTARNAVQRRTHALRRELEHLEETARLRTDFFARMSHELRTPLNAILGMCELLRESGLDRRQGRRVEVMHESASGLLTLINDVLDFSRMESGQVELDDVEFNLHESLDGAVTLLSAEAERKGLELAIDLAADMPVWVRGDPGRLRQVVINLLGNAIKFTADGRVALVQRGWENTADSNLRLTFEVTDTGPGIEPAECERLFEPYSRAHGERQSGTGLGLSITRELVRAMGGGIEVESEPRVGSTFRFDVVLAQAEAIDVATLSRQVELAGVQLLLAEAPSQARDNLAGQLRALGVLVATAGDGDTALDMVRAAAGQGRGYALVLVDMFLPEVAGEAVGRRLLADAATADTAVAMMTTAGVRGDARRLQAIGFSGYLVRPIPPEDLRELLTALLAVQSLPAEERRRQGFVTRHYLREHRRQSERVLLVEDSAVQREVTENMLLPLACSVDVAGTGGEAVELAASADYAVVLMDLQLPDMNGSRAIERIRALDGHRARVSVLVFTAGATEAEKLQCRRAGADGFLFKPLGAADLRATLLRYLPAGAAPAEADADAETGKPGGPPAPDRELVRVFLAEAGERIAEMRSGVAGAVDVELFARHAHALKSASRHVTDGPLPEAAADLEACARRGDIDAVVEAAFPALESAWRRLHGELRSAPQQGQREPPTAAASTPREPAGGEPRMPHSSSPRENTAAPSQTRRDIVDDRRAEQQEHAEGRQRRGGQHECGGDQHAVALEQPEADAGDRQRGEYVDARHR